MLGLKVTVIKAVCKCIDVSELSAKVSCRESQCEGAYDKAVRRCPDVSNVRVLDAAWGVSSREAQCESACCRRDAKVNPSTSLW